MKKLVLLVAVLIGSCTSPKERIPDTMPAAQSSSSKMVVYQVFTRLFGNTNTTNKRFGTTEENGVGKFNDFNDVALEGIKQLGITHIWYTGVLEHAVFPPDDADVVKGRAGSPYAIKDYYDVNHDLAVVVNNRMQEFEQLVERTHKHGMKVIIDFVPNHVARAYQSDAKPEGVKDLGEGDDKAKAFDRDNNFYYIVGQDFRPPKSAMTPMGDGQFAESPAKVTGNDHFSATPGSGDWYETVKLNYGVDIQNNRTKHFDPVPSTWTKMLDILVYWANKDVDAFRCDMAEMVPVEFWEWVIPQVKAVNPDIAFIAEIYNPQAYRSYIEQGHFDYLYDKVQLYDTLRLLVNQHAKSTDVPAIQKSLLGINDHMLHFMENHDEQRIASKFFAGDPWKATPAVAVSALIDKGPMMIYFGQEVGEPGGVNEGFSGDDGRTTIFDYWGVAEHQKWVNNKLYDGGQLSPDQLALRQFYGDVLTLARTNSAISQGDYFDLTESNVALNNYTDHHVIFGRTDGTEKLIIVAGFGTKQERIKVKLTDEAIKMMGLDQNGQYIARDLLRSGTDVGFDAQFQFEIDVPPYSVFILKLK
ncbi:MAG TPA: alpha-amylase family protein [Cyclobacteriaceae bacterium]|nr:alpha-amylase family protein [Cyclobacteriaceae bacterium]